MKLEHTLTPYTKINSKWIKNLNIRQDTIKLLKENIGKTFSDINHTNVFLGQSPKAREIKEKNKQMGPNQVYKLLHSKGNHKQNEKNLRTGRKYLQMMGLDKGLISKIYGQLVQLKQPNRKRGGRPK